MLRVRVMLPQRNGKLLVLVIFGNTGMVIFIIFAQQIMVSLSPRADITVVVVLRLLISRLSRLPVRLIALRWLARLLLQVISILGLLRFVLRLLLRRPVYLAVMCHMMVAVLMRLVCSLVSHIIMRMALFTSPLLLVPGRIVLLPEPPLCRLIRVLLARQRAL